MLLKHKLIYERFAIYFSGVKDLTIGKILQQDSWLYRVLDFIPLFHSLKWRDCSAVVWRLRVKIIPFLLSVLLSPEQFIPNPKSSSKTKAQKRWPWNAILEVDWKWGEGTFQEKEISSQNCICGFLNYSHSHQSLFLHGQILPWLSAAVKSYFCASDIAGCCQHRNDCDNTNPPGMGKLLQ